MESIDDCTDEWWDAPRPKRTQAEIDEDVEYFITHPFNCRELTPEMLEKPEF